MKETGGASLRLHEESPQSKLGENGVLEELLKETEKQLKKEDRNRDFEKRFCLRHGKIDHYDEWRTERTSLVEAGNNMFTLYKPNIK